MKKIFSVLLMAAVILTAALPAYAADLYPASIDYLESGGIPIIHKTYQLYPGDNPADIPTASFERGVFLYSYVDMLKKQTDQFDSKEHLEIVSLPSQNDDMAEVLKLFAPTLDITTDDWYIGTLALNHTSIKVDVDGYSNNSYTVRATRTYPNLSAADISLVPKEIVDKGRTLTLDGVTWQEASSGNVDDYSLPERYTANATYTVKASSRVATGYTATAEYIGTVIKNVPGAFTYTAIFEGTRIAPPSDEQEAAPEPPATRRLPIYVLALFVLLAGGALGYSGLRLVRFIRSRRE